MRIQSVTEVNTWKQKNPFISQSSGWESAGKSASYISFEECLKAQFQNAVTPAPTRNAEWMATSSIWGYFATQGASAKQEIKPKERV